MASIPSLIIPDPASGAAIANPSEVPRSTGDVLGSLVDAFEGLDPLSAEIGRGLLGRRLGIRIPTMSDLNRERAEDRRQQQLTFDREAAFTIRNITGALLDRKDELGIDEDVLQDPDVFRALAKNEFGVELSAQVILAAGEVSATTSPAGRLANAILQTPESRAAAGIKEQAGQIRALETVAEAVKQATTLEGPIGLGLAQILEQESQAAGGVNLGTSIFTDVDEDRGSDAFLRFVGRALDEVGETAGKETVGQTLLQRFGPVIASQLEGLPTDEAGRVMIGQGDTGVTNIATFNLAAALRLLGQELGIDDQQIAQQIGADFTGINPESFLFQAESIGRSFDSSAEEFLKSRSINVSPKERGFLDVARSFVESRATLTQ